LGIHRTCLTPPHLYTCTKSGNLHFLLYLFFEMRVSVLMQLMYDEGEVNRFPFPLTGEIMQLQKKQEETRGSQEPVIAHLDQSCFH